MARRTTVIDRRRRTRRSNGLATNKVWPIVIVVLLLGAAGVGYWFLSSQVDRRSFDAATLCPDGRPTGAVAVLIDVATPMSAVQAIRVRSEIDAILQRVPVGTMVSVGIVGPEGGSTPIFARCRPPRGEEMSNLTANPRQVQGRHDEGFAIPLEAAISDALNRAQDPRAFLPTITGASVRDTGVEVVITLGEAITFAPGDSTLRVEAGAALTRMATALSDVPALELFVVGHTDDRGDPASNQLLSERRAEAVVAALAEAGIPSQQLRAQGRSFHEPVASNETSEGRAANRRVEIIVATRAPIIESVQALVSGTPGLTPPAPGLRQLIIVSDLFQNSPAFSFYRGEGWAEFTASPAFSRVSNGLEDIEVTILRIGRYAPELRDPRVVEDFWQRYLQQQGARIAPPRLIGDR